MKNKWYKKNIKELDETMGMSLEEVFYHHLYKTRGDKGEKWIVTENAIFVIKDESIWVKKWRLPDKEMENIICREEKNND